jgi:hypothetical protein
MSFGRQDQAELCTNITRYGPYVTQRVITLMISHVRSTGFLSKEGMEKADFDACLLWNDASNWKGF